MQALSHRSALQASRGAGQPHGLMTGLTYFEIAQGQAFERCAFGAAAAAVERCSGGSPSNATAESVRPRRNSSCSTPCGARRGAAVRYRGPPSSRAARRKRTAPSTDADAGWLHAKQQLAISASGPCRVDRAVCRDEAKDAREALIASAGRRSREIVKRPKAR